MSEYKMSMEEQDLAEANNLFSEFLEAMNAHVIKFMESISEKAGTTHYDVFIRLGKSVLNHYNDDIRNTIIRICNEWNDGDQSYAAVAKKSLVGDDAIGTATNFAGDLLNSVDEILKPQDESLFEIDTSAPKFSEQDFEDLQENLKTVAIGIDDDGDSFMSRFESLGEDNNIMKLISAPMTCVHETIGNTFKNFAEKAMESVKTNMDNINSASQQTMDEAKENAKTSASSAADELSEADLSAIENIFSGTI